MKTMIRRTLMSLALFSVLASCGGGLADFRDGVPVAKAVEVSIPDNQALAGGGQFGQGASGLEGDLSGMYQITRASTRFVNGGVAWILGTVKFITLRKPDALDSQRAVWGPFTPDLGRITWILTVTRVEGEAHSYDWELQGKPKGGEDSAYVTVLTGTHTRAMDGNRPRVGFGSGTFFIDWEARKTLPDARDNDAGTTDVTYANLSEEDPVTIDVHFEGAVDPETGVPVTGDYLYTRDAVAGGTFQFKVVTDMDNNGSAMEDLTIKSRWTPDGAGRSDVRATNGNLQSAATLSECWDDLFSSTWLSSSFTTDPAWNWGADTTCAFADADYAEL